MRRYLEVREIYKPNEDAMDFEIISSLTVEELKYYLEVHGLKSSGRKVELVARVFAASENNVPLVQSAVEIEQELQQEYSNKLIIDDFTVPDPLTLESGWHVREKKTERSPGRWSCMGISSCT